MPHIFIYLCYYWIYGWCPPTTSCSVTSWSILRFQATWTLPPIARAHFHISFMKSCCVYSSSVKQCLRSVNHEQFPIQMTHNSSTASGCNSSPNKIFSTKIPLERERRLEIQREQRRRRLQQEIAKQREHRLTHAKATPTARDRGTEEQEIGMSEA